MAGEVVVDALPYYDIGYVDSGVREAATALVEEETRRYRPTKDYLDYLPPANFDGFLTDILRHELERVAARAPMEMLSMKRYELPQPPGGKMTDLAAWNECVDNAHAQLEHQGLRILNLEIMSQYGANAWKMYNTTLQVMVEKGQKQLTDIRKQIQEINWQRKQEQTEAGAKLKNLEESWVSLVSKNYEIEQACVELEQETYEISKVKLKPSKSKRKRRKEQAAAAAAAAASGTISTTSEETEKPEKIPKKVKTNPIEKTDKITTDIVELPLNVVEEDNNESSK